MALVDTTVSGAGTWRSTEKASLGFGRQGEKAAGLRGFLLQKPEESLPRYASPAPAGVSRAPSTSSASSSFYSHERHDDAQSHHDERPAGDGPTFRSSPTAL